MLCKRCPHTGVVNFFTKTDPFVSIGSIVEAGVDSGRQQGEYHWRVYDAAQTISGIAADMAEAERRLKRQFLLSDSRLS